MMENTLEDEISEEFFNASTLQIRDDKVKSPESEKMGKASTVEIEEKWKIGNTIPVIKEKFDNLLSKNSTSTALIEPSVLPLIRENAMNYFTFREGIVDRAVKDCMELLIDEENDGRFVDYYLLTEINLWDSDKERLILIAEKVVYTIKYDFIALKCLDFKRIDLLDLDSVIVGDLIYPNGSLVPRINGLVDGFSGAVQTCMFKIWSKSEFQVENNFQPRDRNMKGVRLLWNKGQPLSFTTKWNPFNNEVPLITFTSHPLYFHKDCNKDFQHIYDIDEFHLKLGIVLTDLENIRTNLDTNKSKICVIRHENITLQSYVGLSSLIHNRNALGFFKVRGKFSF